MFTNGQMANGVNGLNPPFSLSLSLSLSLPPSLSLSAVDPDARTAEGDTALHIVAGAIGNPSDQRLVTELLRHNAAVDVINAAGNTPLFNACRYAFFPPELMAT
jgi:ankyrin repeat protein